jgi:predicted nucleotidyltransferase component of viral defense system/N-acetylglutamate synthase-like GNAT family acetyltransferase
MNEAPSKTLIEEVALLMSLSPSYIEKDWYIVQILALLSKLQHEKFTLIFAGGTALSKTHKLISRMSEDIDFKVNIHDKSQLRKSLSEFKKFIVSQIENSGLQISIRNVRAQNENQFFAFEIDYPSYFDHNSSLRNHILLEVTVKQINLEPVYKSISSFISELLKSKEEVSQIACLDPVENAADKLSALSWRIPDRIRNDIYDDPSIVRHLHDLAILKDIVIDERSFGSLALKALDEDKNRSKNNLTYVHQSLEDKFSNMIYILKNDKEYPKEYKYFVESMSYAAPNSTPSYEVGMKALEGIIHEVLKIKNIVFKVIEYGEKEYAQAILLRKEVLYKTRILSSDDYNKEENHLQIAGFVNDIIIATCSLVPEGDNCCMRYVAIKADVQGNGIGSKMLEYFEKQAIDKGFKSIYCHARVTAINFYKKNGYLTEGDVFEHFTISHIKMRKILF